MLVENPVEGVDVDGISDAIFVQLCSMARDMDMKVRMEAFMALEKVKVVSESMLLQSLSKKVIRTSKGGGEIAEHTVHLITESNCSLSSAAGAFIHGLEDEFYEVREAACISLGTLSILSLKFADGALNLLMDMLNDDKMAVKLRTLEIFLDMARYDRLKVHEIHVHMFLSMFVDISSSIRHAARKVVCVVALLDMKMFKSSVHILLTSLEKYPEDEEDIFFALFNVCKNHGKFAACFVEESIHEIDTSHVGEVNLDKARVAALLVITIGVHFSCGKITCHIPQRVFSYAISFLGRISSSLRRLISCEHLLAYLCLKSGRPFSLMNLELKEKEESSNPVDGHILEHTCPLDPCSLLCLVQGKLPETSFNDGMMIYRWGSNSVGQSQMIEMVNEDAKLSIVVILKTIAEMWPMIPLHYSHEVQCTLRTCKKQLEMMTEDGNGCLSAYVAFATQYIQVIQLIAETWMYFSPRKVCVLGVRRSDILLVNLDRALRKLRYTFPGYSREEEAHILELTLLCCVARLNGIGICPQPLLKKMQSMISYLEDLLQCDPSIISDFIKELKKAYGQAGNSKAPFQIPVDSLLKLFLLREMQFSGRFRHIKANLGAPGNDSENPLPFISGLPVGLPLQIMLHNVSKSDRVWLQMMVGASTQHVLLDLHQFEGTDEMRSCAANIPFYGAPRAVMFVLKATVIMECPSQHATRLRIGRGGPRYETTAISASKDIYLVNIGNR